MPESQYLLDVLALLLAAIVAVPIFQKLRMPAVVGYLVAGTILGPYVPGPVVDSHMPLALAEFGVVFLLFSIGLELPLSRLQAMRRYIFGLGVLQVLVTSAAIGVLGFFGLGLTAEAALVIGGTLAFSSTATVLGMLVERGETTARHGRVAIAVLIFQDLAVVPMLTLLPLLAGNPESIAAALGLAAVKGAAAIAVILVLGRFVVRPVYHFIASTRSPEVFSATNLFLVLAVGWVTAQVGMSMALGAFLAGLLLADTAYRHQVESDIEPFRGLLLGLFFMTVGMSLDLPLMAARTGVVIGATVALLAGKAAILVILCRVTGLGLPTALRVGLVLAQGSEFAFVIIGHAMASGVVAPQDGQIVVTVVALSMALTPALGALAHRLARAHEHRWGTERFGAEAGDRSAHVVIAGYGRVGRAVARILTNHGIPFVALDLDSQRVAKARESGLPVFYGDASHAGVLRAAGIERARAAVVTVNRPLLAEKAVACIRRVALDLPIIVRSHDLGQRPLLEAAGASEVVPEAMEASLQLAGLTLRNAGIEADVIERSLDEYRRDHYGLLTDGGPGAAPGVVGK